MLAAVSQIVRFCCHTTAVFPRLWSASRSLRTYKLIRPYAVSPQSGGCWTQQTRCCTSTVPAANSGAQGADDAPLEPGLYLVGTPIGNLDDLSVRALKILQTATVILAEDTRHSRKLLNHYGIRSYLHSFHQHNEHSKQARVGSTDCKALCTTLFGLILQ